MRESQSGVPCPKRDASPRAQSPSPRDALLTVPDADAEASAAVVCGDYPASAVAVSPNTQTSTLAIRSRQSASEAGTRSPPADADEVSPGPFFEVLTFDLRYHIYQLAFGSKILHLYLLYRRGLQPDVRWRKGHQPVPAFYPHSPGVSCMDPPSADASTAPEWYWWSCVCAPENRNLETKLGDQCPRGFFQSCAPKETYLGVLPWLLTCRRAYEETIKVLYASNTFKFEQRLEAMYFPYAITTSHLEWITSLEIRIPDRDESLIDRTLDKAPRPSQEAPLIEDLRALSARDQYLQIINQIEPTFPALRRLHISFEGSVRRVPVPKPNVTTLLISTIGEVDADELEALILGPIDALPRNVEKQVLFYQSLYTALIAAEERQRGEEIQEVEHMRNDGRPGWTKYWRSLATADEPRAGYWVCKHG
ncbi:hypothetical protein Cob_v003338 [Colletotrichum orbiculare MAFF 240422]|uniref:DUF7730 domain-containing protein n=1 Tax=Colletotrichum orbiculare (strain 104-T / ATCC 96160 / CBS 514.97 / LARS 414 / MAFF 240422) TaxID=1213857 RepID=N4VIY0_COLOR|nr:hypothetical protein Cob_v003338 [Colletotrichum orbiculare MAFF 240422]